jgi:hypothetical protein
MSLTRVTILAPVVARTSLRVIVQGYRVIAAESAVIVPATARLTLSGQRGIDLR